jgi:hypothetical protein
VKRNAAAVSVVSFMSAISGGPSSNATTAAKDSSARKVAIVTMPSRPRPSFGSRPATATNSNETTNGTTVIRIALTQSCPSGAMRLTMRSAVALWVAEITLPRIKPAKRPMTTR